MPPRRRKQKAQIGSRRRKRKVEDATCEDGVASASLDACLGDECASAHDDAVGSACLPEQGIGTANSCVISSSIDLPMRKRKKPSMDVASSCSGQFMEHEDLQFLHTRVHPGASFRRAAASMLQSVTEVATSCFSDLKCDICHFGSFAQETCTAHSDVDICISPVNGTPPRKRVVRLLQRLEACIQRRADSGGLSVVEAIYEASIPILRIRMQVKEAESASCMEADVCIDESSGCLDCDGIIRGLLAENDAARSLVLYVKHWARERAFNKAFLGYPSSFSWVLLATFFLQRSKVLPACQPSASFRQLLSDFFAFLQDPLLLSKGISVARGGVWIDRPSEVEGRVRRDSPLFLEVPLFPWQNAARSLRQECWQQILHEAIRARKLLETYPYDTAAQRQHESCLAALVAHQA
eukprot:TRINITY_DN65543_c0_g1_i1.p1 TRINITY_DN65543_c0_g1~~TRINITY_DN65543_c0_g1_i1.p1  ORF type:complete len:410 (-),score=47.70 TRINITY_DN65543_c0_g1_i1:184-1413(-)